MAGISNLHVGRLTAEDGRVRAVTDGIIADEAAHATPTNSGVVSAMDAGETVQTIEQKQNNANAHPNTMKQKRCNSCCAELDVDECRWSRISNNYHSNHKC